MLSHLTITDVQRGVNAHPGIADFRLRIADIRNSKLETRNSQETLLQPNGAEFRFSSFDFLPPQSAIDNRQSTIDTERVCQLTDVEQSRIEPSLNSA
jgi:hypothetical protein